MYSWLAITWLDGHIGLQNTSKMSHASCIIKEPIAPPSENTIILFVCPLKFCTSIVFVSSWDHSKSQEKLETMLMQNLAGQTKSIMVFSEVAYFRYSLIASDVTAAILVERTIEEKSFGNLILLLCKSWATFFYCFGTNMAVLSWVKTCFHISKCPWTWGA